MTTAVDELGVHHLLARYADVVNRRTWSELDALFTADAGVAIDTISRPLIELRGVTALEEFLANAIERFDFFEFVVLNTVVDPIADDPEGAGARTFMCEIRHEKSTDQWSTAFGVYHDELQQAGDRWRFARRAYQTLARTQTGEVFPFPGQPRFASPRFE